MLYVLKKGELWRTPHGGFTTSKPDRATYPTREAADAAYDAAGRPLDVCVSADNAYELWQYEFYTVVYSPPVTYTELWRYDEEMAKCDWSGAAAAMFKTGWDCAAHHAAEGNL